MEDTGYRAEEGLAVYESAMARPYFSYLQIILRRLLQQYKLSGGSCVDLACGGGHVVQLLATLGWKARGCDLSADMVTTAQHNYPALREQFFVADMCALPPQMSLDLVTVVFNSIHYLSPQQRPAFWGSVAHALKPGGFLLSQQNAHRCMRDYWLGQTHRWESEGGFAFWTGSPGREPDSISVEKLYFEKQAGDRWKLSKARHPYYFFEIQEMRDGLAQHGVEIVDELDGMTLSRNTSASQAIWVIATKRSRNA